MVATAIAFQVAVHALDLHAVFVIVASLGWKAYVLVRLRDDPGRLERWWLGTRHLRSALVAATSFALPALAIIAAIGASHGRLGFRLALLSTLLLYPIWGLVQQTLVQVFVARILRRASSPPSGAVFVVVSCALLFGFVHAPDTALVVATAVMGAALTSIYLHGPSLWPLCLWHGWLGAFFYAWCLDRYALVELLS